MQHTSTSTGLRTVVLRVILSFAILMLQETIFFIHTALILSGQASYKRAL
ncbi:hypothetical protein IFM47457_10399 [Aspergillus lentulus]|nr:hypothetical protein IFM47457_10399 [Aspergillus lentulus]